MDTIVAINNLLLRFSAAAVNFTHDQPGESLLAREGKSGSV
jgi:hypothetical protein